ncbi:MAG: hypothetical protein G3W58_22970 [Pantoea ananatis]|nr:hypothetical protein [Pantoea ananatis]
MNPHFSVQVFYSLGYQVAAILSLSVIMFFCLWSIFSDRVNDGLLGRVLFSVAAFACFAGLYHMAQGTYPQRTTITVFACLAMLSARRMIIYYFWDTVRRKYYFELRRLRSQRKANERDI